MKQQDKESIFQQPLWVALFAFTAAFLWGWAYPFIKLGFAEFQISSDMTGSKMLFAGIRFCLSGLIILTIGRLTNRSFSLNDAYRGKRFTSLLFLLLFALLNIQFITAEEFFASFRMGVDAVTIIIGIAVGVAIPNIFIHRQIERRKQDNVQKLLAKRYAETED